MGESTFWDNPERAQQIIQQLKPLNGLLKPFEDLQAASHDLEVLAEFAAEDPSHDRELEDELGRIEKRLDEFELRAMLSGPQDASNAYLRIQAGTGGTKARELAQIPKPLDPRWAQHQGYHADIGNEPRNQTA